MGGLGWEVMRLTVPKYIGRLAYYNGSARCTGGFVGPVEGWAGGVYIGKIAKRALCVTGSRGRAVLLEAAMR